MPDIPALKNITYSNTTLFVVPHNRLISFSTSSFLMIPMPSFSNTDTYIYTTSCIIRLFLYICSFLCILLPFFHIHSLDVRLLSEFIEKMVKELPPRQQEVFNLSRNAHLTYKEISIRLNISEKTVERHINEALKFLKKNIMFYLIFIF